MQNIYKLIHLKRLMELDITKTKEKIEEAKKAVKHMQDDEYKMKSFEVILNSLLQGKILQTNEKVKGKPIKTQSNEKAIKEQAKGIKKLMEDAGVNEDQFNSLFDVEKNKINIYVA